jgi:hypothetical protein
VLDEDEPAMVPPVAKMTMFGSELTEQESVVSNS